MLLLLFTTLSYAAGCPEGTAPARAELDASLDAIESAWSNADPEGFSQAVDALEATLPCLSETVSRKQVARVHRLMGIGAFADREADRAAYAFAAAKAVEPAYRFPPTLVSEAHPIFDLYLKAPVAPSADSVDAPLEGELSFDARQGLMRPRERSTVAQYTTGDTVRGSAYLWPGDPMLPYPKKPVAPAPVVLPPVAEKTKSGPGLSIPLAIGGGVAVLAAGGTYAAASTARSRYDEAPLEHKAPLRSRTNSLVATSAGLGAVGLAAGIGAVVVGEW